MVLDRTVGLTLIMIHVVVAGAMVEIALVTENGGMTTVKETAVALGMTAVDMIMILVRREVVMKVWETEVFGAVETHFIVDPSRRG